MTREKLRDDHQYQHGDAKQLIINMESCYKTTLVGEFRSISPDGKLLVEVRFIPEGDINYLIGYVEKWNSHKLSVITNNGSNEKPEWKHHLLLETHNIGWKRIRLHKK